MLAVQGHCKRIIKQDDDASSHVNSREYISHSSFLNPPRYMGQQALIALTIKHDIVDDESCKGITKEGCLPVSYQRNTALEHLPSRGAHLRETQSESNIAFDRDHTFSQRCWASGFRVIGAHISGAISLTLACVFQCSMTHNRSCDAHSNHEQQESQCFGSI